MARKPHKFADNGVSLSTTLSEANLRAICAIAAEESTGDLWNGKQKIVETGSGEGITAHLIKDALLGWSKLLNFTITYGEADGRSTLETEILNYVTTQTTVYGIPAGAKKMVAHHTYMQFVHKVANTVREADATATIRVAEGVVGVAEPAVAPQPGLAATPKPPTLAQTAPPPPPPTESAPPPPPPTTESILDEAHLDRTQRVVRKSRGPAQWVLAPDNLPERPLGSTTYLGRDPHGVEPHAVLVRVPDDEFTVSKTHARLDYADGTMRVTDLDSTNGTFLVDQFDDMVQCEPNVPTEVKPGVGVELGAYAVAFIQRRTVADS